MNGILNFPLKDSRLYNLTRRLIAGDQKATRVLVESYLKDFDCQSVLDICCGTGDFALCSNKTRYLGIDNNLNFINFAKKRFKENKKVKFITADILKTDKLPKFDAILLISTIHHFSDLDLATIIKLVKKAAKKLVVVADIIPNPPTILSKFFVYLDNGKFIRKSDRKLIFFKKHFNIIDTRIIRERFAYQFIIVAKPKR